MPYILQMTFSMNIYWHFLDSNINCNLTCGQVAASSITWSLTSCWGLKQTWHSETPQHFNTTTLTASSNFSKHIGIVVLAVTVLNHVIHQSYINMFFVISKDKCFICIFFLILIKTLKGKYTLQDKKYTATVSPFYKLQIPKEAEEGHSNCTQSMYTKREKKEGKKKLKLGTVVLVSQNACMLSRLN